MKIKFCGVQFAPHAPSPSWIVSCFLLHSVCTVHVTSRLSECGGMLWCVCVCVCERERERERIVKEEGKKAHVRRFFKSIYVPKNETCLFVLSKCKHDILIMFRFCALKEYSNLRHTTNRYTCVKYVLSHNDNYQCVSIALAIVIISAAAQQHKQYNKLPNYVSGTTERYNKCLKFSIWPQNVSWRTV